MATTKVGAVHFEHSADFTAEVEITNTKSGASIKVPFASLRAVVAESVRHDSLRGIENMKPDQLLKKLA